MWHCTWTQGCNGTDPAKETAAADATATAAKLAAAAAKAAAKTVVPVKHGLQNKLQRGESLLLLFFWSSACKLPRQHCGSINVPCAPALSMSQHV